MNQPHDTSKWTKLKQHLFFSNYFYGLCAVALAIEAMLQQRLPLNHWTYFVVTFVATVLFYSYPYVRKCSYISSNSRTNWYTRHYTWMRWNQVIIAVSLLVVLVLFLYRSGSVLFFQLPLSVWLLIFIFPFIAFLYYGAHFFSKKFNLRKIGWLKPFIIGFIWTGMVTVYPVLFYAIINNKEYAPGWQGFLLSLKNFMFISLLCIMFDVKDYAADYIARVKTFVVKIGLRKTIFYILLPMALAGLGSFIYYAIAHEFHPFKVVLNIIPFLLLVITSFSLCRRRPLLYYLTVIDGLMIVKATCGIIAVIYF